MRFLKYLHEAVHAKNIGFEEMVSFMQVATDSQVAQMDKIVKKADWNAFKKIIKKVLGKELK
jgi:hypothetical protein